MTGYWLPSRKHARSNNKYADPTLALAIADGTGENEQIHIRGSHKNLGDVVPRRFLEVLGGSNSVHCAREAAGSSWRGGWSIPRANPLLPRVLVNRLWKHHFGEGHRQDDRRLRRNGAKAQPPGAARLAGRRAGRARLVAKGDAPTHGHVEHIPDGERSPWRRSSGSTRPIPFCTG